MYKKSVEQPAEFWGDYAGQFYWEKKWDDDHFHYNFDIRKGPVSVEMFKGGRTNICYNALDKNIKEGLGKDICFYWEGNDPGKQSTMTYQEVYEEVCRTANWLKSVGVRKGDTVSLYLPMVCELPISMLACARIGAIHSVVFGGFSAESLAGRIEDCKAKVLLTCSGVMRGDKPINLKRTVDDALTTLNDRSFNVETVLVLETEAIPASKTPMTPGRDLWWGPAVKAQPASCPVEWVDAEHPLFLLYTSGSTGKPKGVQHNTGGYMAMAAATCQYVMQLQRGDVWWCTADCGWITGHTYVAYGPLLCGAGQVIFEGIPTYPTPARCWEIVDKYKVTQFYTAPTAIRSLMRYGAGPVHTTKRTSLRLLGSVGEPINPEAWKWYHEVVGDGRCGIMDTWWQTETGAHMITPLLGCWPEKPGSATLPFFGVLPAILDEKGVELEGACEGYLVLKQAWPSTIRGVWGDKDRYENVYFSNYPGYYFTGDGARRDEDGYYWITGRVDDVINVSGHRIGTAEVEDALTQHDACSESAVIGVDHPVKGQAVYAYVSLAAGVAQDEGTKSALREHVRQVIGAFAIPDVIHWAPGLPKTRSGKIMRRVLRKIASGEYDQLGDVSTLAEPAVVEELIRLKDK